MSGRVNSNSELDERRDTSGGISWTTFKRSPGESKNGYFLCRNCGFEIIHASMIDTESNSEYIESSEQGNTKLENEGDQHSLFKDVLKCKQCEENVGFTSELKQEDNDTVTVKLFCFQTKTLVYETDSLTCEKCGCDVDIGDNSTTVTYKRQCLSFAVVLVPIKNENGKFYDVKTFWEVIQERNCKKCGMGFCKPGKLMDICCFDCNALIGLTHVSTEENERTVKSFVGYILPKLNRDVVDRIQELSTDLQLETKTEVDRIKELSTDLQLETGTEVDRIQELSTDLQLETETEGYKTISSTDNFTPQPFTPYYKKGISGNIAMNPQEDKPSFENGNMTRKKRYAKPNLFCLQKPRTEERNEFPTVQVNSSLEKYKMEKEKRGWCLIINNKNFKDPALKRHGSDRDEERLYKEFKRLKFKVRKKKDKSGQEMVSILSKYAAKDHSSMDCFVCCILSHGEKDEISGYDSECVSIETITKCFRAEACTSLAGKPKLFFFQACQGSKRMGGWQVDSGYVADQKRRLEVGSVPDEADFLLGFATTSGYVSYRDDGEGSVYIQMLCNLLELYSRQYDLLTIMTILHQKVSEEIFVEDTEDTEKKTGTGKTHHKQMPATIHRLRKQLYFNV